MRILFMGTPDFAVPCLRALVENQYNVIGVVTQPDRPKGRKQVLTPPPVKIAAEALGIPVYQPEKVSAREHVEFFQTLSIDLVITAAFGQLLSKEFLAIPRLGCINVHASLLPKYRGGAPIHWSVINGETETGVTIMYMEEKLDAGDILSQKKVDIEFTDTTGIVYEKVTQAGAQLLIETLPDLVTGKLTPVKQNQAMATFAYNIRRQDEAIDWNKDAFAIYNQIRGLSPWPGAYTTVHGQILKVLSSEIYDASEQTEIGTEDVQTESAQTGIQDAQAGEIVGFTRKGPVILTGNGQIVLTQVQPAGKKMISGVDYVNSGKIRIGDLLAAER